ncbi:hypothetical protein M501DRAFT_195687 [Patellaria atrata CBS 101060]|uniref:rRNA-processing protein FYV7 n=1 Tax=Patellaria atrata CBS 101060 TaxID=1346257 RepID=A0A9P4S6X1_9PEZI|nr:hypothetical protein M501DRAFT_195687 [Patellaria atrata CBS 101060]
MGTKRPYPDTTPIAHPPKKHKKGFDIVPPNLPDGLHKRKIQKIKRDLIHKAKVKKAYAKIKEREIPSTQPRVVGSSEDEGQDASSSAAASMQLHPERLRRLDEPKQEQDEDVGKGKEQGLKRRDRPKKSRFAKETSEAAERKAEREWKEKLRFRKSMAKAKKVGPDGRRKLGRESKVLLERVRKLMGSINDEKDA